MWLNEDNTTHMLPRAVDEMDKDSGASIGNKNSKAYEREFGKPYEGKMDGEVEYAEFNLRDNI